MENIKKVAVFSARKHDITFFNKAVEELKPNLQFTFLETPLKLENVSLSQGYDAICVFVHEHITQPILQKLKEYGVKLIASRSAGCSHIDIEAANELSLKVVTVPDYSPYCHAEFAVCLLMTLNRKLKKSIFRTLAGNFELDGLLGFNIFGKTIGVIGTGRTGLCFIKIMLGFGAKILCFDTVKNPEVRKLGLTYSTLEEIFSKSDVISLHCHLTKENFHIINREAINKMKQGVYIINVSSGALIDTEAAIEGLKSGKIGGLGKDVIENEEGIFFTDKSDEVIKDDNISRLMSFNNVLLTGHQAFFTVEALEKITYTTVLNVMQVLNGKDCPNYVH